MTMTLEVWPRRRPVEGIEPRPPGGKRTVADGTGHDRGRDQGIETVPGVAIEIQGEGGTVTGTKTAIETEIGGVDPDPETMNGVVHGDPDQGIGTRGEGDGRELVVPCRLGTRRLKQ